MYVYVVHVMYVHRKNKNTQCIFIFLVPGTCTTCTKEIQCIDLNGYTCVCNRVLGALKIIKIVNEGQSICNCLLNA
jgi:hypothetical protein